MFGIFSNLLATFWHSGEQRSSILRAQSRGLSGEGHADKNLRNHQLPMRSVFPTDSAPQ